MPSARRRAAWAALALASFLAGCGGDGDGGGDDGATATGRFGALHTEVCRAVDQAAAGDTDEARRTFDDAHFGLHALVTAVEASDRRVAAELLEATQEVEAGLSEASLEDLAGPVAAAVEATGGTAPESCP